MLYDTNYKRSSVLALFNFVSELLNFCQRLHGHIHFGLIPHELSGGKTLLFALFGGGGGGRRTSECLTNIDRLITATKVSLDLNDSSSDNLGMAAVIIHDLKQKRTRDYEFNWNIALDVSIEKHQPINFLYDLTAKK